MDLCEGEVGVSILADTETAAPSCLSDTFTTTTRNNSVHMPGRRVPRRKPCQSVTPGCALRNRRLISTCEVLTGDKLGPVEVQKHEHRTFRVRKDGKPLPLPPVLDPVILEERSRWSKPKAKRDVNKFTPFQQKLFANPYGMPPSTRKREILDTDEPKRTSSRLRYANAALLAPCYPATSSHHSLRESTQRLHNHGFCP